MRNSDAGYNANWLRVTAAVRTTQHGSEPIGAPSRI